MFDTGGQNPIHDRVAQRTDWLVYTVRWILLGTMFWRLDLDGGHAAHGLLAYAPLGLLAALNAAQMLMQFLHYAPAALPYLTLLVDIGLGLWLFAATGGQAGPLPWVMLYPALTAAIRHAWFVSLAYAVLGLGAQVLVVNAMGAGLAGFPVLAGLVLIATGGAALAGTQLRQFLQAQARREIELRDNKVQAARQHARAIYEMASMVSATLGYEKVLEAALKFGALGAEGRAMSESSMCCAVLLFDDDRTHLRVTSSWRLPPADSKVLCPAEEGILAHVTRTGDYMLSDAPGNDPELMSFIGFRQCRSLIALPLRVAFDSFGVILYGHTAPDFFNDDTRNFLNAMVNQSVVAIQNARLYQTLRTEKERIVQVQEEANKKLARDLHDGPTQAVAALAMRANFARRLVERDPRSAADELFKMEELARKTTKEIRHMLFTLRPLILESQGLSAALKQLGEKVRETHDQNVIVEIDPGIDDLLEKSRQGVLFYIAEEAANNAVKHAQAQHIWVRLKVSNDTLTLEIRDDGVGFNVGAVDSEYDRRSSLGMVNMRERTEMLNGTVRIDSAEGQGTRILVVVPLITTE
ncbi:MAG TPA: GAF domain-containing sensor histidine kinase [Anaerolineales bacterium]|nr:GAF domain-containing sensor histidine kinase [Anaerolineales bacterium]